MCLFLFAPRWDIELGVGHVKNPGKRQTARHLRPNANPLPNHVSGVAYPAIILVAEMRNLAPWAHAGNLLGSWMAWPEHGAPGAMLLPRKLGTATMWAEGCLTMQLNLTVDPLNLQTCRSVPRPILPSSRQTSNGVNTHINGCRRREGPSGPPLRQG
jgi:hypothetical protein